MANDAIDPKATLATHSLRKQWTLQLRGRALVSIGGGEDSPPGRAGDSTNVSQTFQPSGLLLWSNSSKRVQDFADMSDDELREYVHGNKELDA
jgi:hypothetical protein